MLHSLIPTPKRRKTGKFKLKSVNLHVDSRLRILILIEVSCPIQLSHRLPISSFQTPSKSLTVSLRKLTVHFCMHLMLMKLLKRAASIISSLVRAHKVAWMSRRLLLSTNRLQCFLFRMRLRRLRELFPRSSSRIGIRNTVSNPISTIRLKIIILSRIVKIISRHVRLWISYCNRIIESISTIHLENLEHKQLSSPTFPSSKSPNSGSILKKFMKSLVKRSQVAHQI